MKKEKHEKTTVTVRLTGLPRRSGLEPSMHAQEDQQEQDTWLASG